MLNNHTAVSRQVNCLLAPSQLLEVTVKWLEIIHDFDKASQVPIRTAKVGMKAKQEEGKTTKRKNRNTETKHEATHDENKEQMRTSRTCESNQVKNLTKFKKSVHLGHFAWCGFWESLGEVSGRGRHWGKAGAAEAAAAVVVHLQTGIGSTPSCNTGSRPPWSFPPQPARCRSVKVFGNNQVRSLNVCLFICTTR